MADTNTNSELAALQIAVSEILADLRSKQGAAPGATHADVTLDSKVKELRARGDEQLDAIAMQIDKLRGKN